MVLSKGDMKAIGNVSKTLYNLDMVKEELDPLQVVLLWLVLGDVHLRTFVRRTTLFSKEEEFEYEFLVLKRRSFHHYIEDTLLKRGDRHETLRVLESVYLTGLDGVSQDLEIKMALVVMGSLDLYSFEDFLKVCIIMSRMESTSESFWGLAELVMEEHLDRMMVNPNKEYCEEYEINK